MNTKNVDNGLVKDFSAFVKEYYKNPRVWEALQKSPKFLAKYVAEEEQEDGSVSVAAVLVDGSYISSIIKCKKEDLDIFLKYGVKPEGQKGIKFD